MTICIYYFVLFRRAYILWFLSPCLFKNRVICVTRSKAIRIEWQLHFFVRILKYPIYGTIKKRIALRMKATFLDFIREVPISSLVTTGMEQRGVKKKKRSGRKGDEEDRGEKSGSFREWEHVGKYKMWSDWCSCNLRADFLGEVHDSSPVIGDF